MERATEFLPSSTEEIMGQCSREKKVRKRARSKKRSKSRSLSRSRHIDKETNQEKHRQKNRKVACTCEKIKKENAYQSLPVLHSKDGSAADTGPGMCNVVAIDCEMVGVGFKMDSSIGRCSIVDGQGSVLMDTFVVPPEGVSLITDYRTRYSGIRKCDMRDAIPFADAMSQAKSLLQGRVVVGHALHNDFRVMHFRIPEVDVRDTSQYRYLHTLAHEAEQENKTTPEANNKTSLKSLTRRLLNRRIQGQSHDSVEDARAALDLYKLVHQQWEEDQPMSTPQKTQQLTLPCRGCRLKCNSKKRRSFRDIVGGQDTVGSKKIEGNEDDLQPQRVRRKRALTETSEDIAQFVEDKFWEDFPDI